MHTIRSVFIILTFTFHIFILPKFEEIICNLTKIVTYWCRGVSFVSPIASYVYLFSFIKH